MIFTGMPSLRITLAGERDIDLRLLQSMRVGFEIRRHFGREA